MIGTYVNILSKQTFLAAAVLWDQSISNTTGQELAVAAVNELYDAQLLIKIGHSAFVQMVTDRIQQVVGDQMPGFAIESGDAEKKYAPPGLASFRFQGPTLKAYASVLAADGQFLFSVKEMGLPDDDRLNAQYSLGVMYGAEGQIETIHFEYTETVLEFLPQIKAVLEKSAALFETPKLASLLLDQIVLLQSLQ